LGLWSAPSEQGKEFVDGEPGVADEGSKGSNRKLYVLRDRKIGPGTGLNQDQMVPYLPAGCQPAFWKAFTASLPEMLASLPIQLNGYDDLLAARLFGKLRSGFLVLGPKPSGDGFFDVFEGLFFVFSLGNTAGECWTLCYNPAVLRLIERHVENHKNLFLCAKVP
jgi:hypothetical protein